jgi:hypothetical protein
MPPVEEARSVFSRLGYEVSGDGSELEARRKWRTVRVRVVPDGETPATPQPRADGGTDGGPRLQCFVTWTDHAGRLRERLERRDPGCEWAVIGVDDAGGYEVVGHADSSGS